MSDPNPYAPPGRSVEQTLSKEAAKTDRLGIPSDVELPAVCAKCGGINNVSGRPKVFRMPRPIFVLIYLAAFFTFVFYKGWPLSVMNPSVKGAAFVALYGVQFLS